MDTPIYTIGHSTRELDELITVLRAYKITQLIDIRTIPKSRRVPQFNEDNLAKELPKHRIDYQHFDSLGGLRPTNKQSINQGWHNKSFRGYADYMQTDEFTKGIDRLLALTEGKVSAIMCAEVLPWRCHRSMVGDALLVRGWCVTDIYDEKKAELETLTSFALVDGTRITYPTDLPKNHDDISCHTP